MAFFSHSPYTDNISSLLFMTANDYNEFIK